MQAKLAIFCVLIALAVPSCALAENLVDRSEKDDSSSSGSIFDLFKSMRGPANGSPGAGESHGCEPYINAAGNSVYVRREGCPRS